ncbi:MULTISPECIES: 3-oxoacid CoA-transferase subunit A [unclassified Rhizobium]|uniref:3-oxoacid CoA-transferase subunit A n=1 Tax=unclassified Rhizobium TaxID=2613769 RepID=UPI001ADAC817|nr:MULTISPECIES: 3-oxoacid CoA-transferase subunit A [unclassified Rhizobium]MBO9100485.1 3-oxoacid CoA-transferase subunit A [Rhizobium sp. L58/93]MBO9136153.1 3-oxoacid CoA-transferase subunit A [Rhizobium sp. B209b/85]MBO9171464.1 3-oxoacid CoA-transferase subunit A [Rhizobium sp. L245/93]MBO9187331.1 3-oxoacid CoA-transferase subunit A [Rhizobium sp. E27B/91]QXZ88004.1 3-oxoacid CoA-transferase subunit A [Rhizobium sp. K1/93]
MDKTIGSTAEAVADIGDGATVMIGGFGGSGAPIELIHALIDKGPRNLTVINNNAGNGRIGIAAMIDAGMVRKMICSFPRSSDPRAFTDRYLAGEIELELVPQGTLAERIRAGGAGIPAFYTPTAFGTELAEGKPIAEFEGRSYVQERWLKADFAIVKAHVGDVHGNLTYNKAGRNFNPLMCMAAARTIVQVSKIVAAGEIDPEQVVTPGIFVNHIVEVANPRQEEDLIRAGVAYA